MGAYGGGGRLRREAKTVPGSALILGQCVEDALDDFVALDEIGAGSDLLLEFLDSACPVLWGFPSGRLATVRL